METCPRCGAFLPDERLQICPCCLLATDDDAATEAMPGGATPANARHGDDACDEDATRIVIGDKLRLGEMLGRGGMGTVYRAQHVELGRAVAVKFLPDDLAALDEFQARFEREARALAMLNHPHIVAVYDFDAGEKPYIVMELASGGSLADKLPLDRGRALELALETCDALVFAHAHGVIHRDVKPQNVLLDSNDRVKVSDFGLARLVHPDARGWTVTGPDQAVGTPHYMAPEVLDGAPPDARMDVYSLGVLLYQMLTGKLPVGSYEIPPGKLGATIQKALRPDPAERYQSMAALRADLETVQSALRKPSCDLEAEEKNWLRGVALVASVATAVGLWAFLECLTPKILDSEEVRSLVMTTTESLEDGRVRSPVRFETWPVLGALAAAAVAMFAYALLRRHWRASALDTPQSDRPIPEVCWVLRLGALAIGVFALRLIVERWGSERITAYTPLIGGAIEVAWLFAFWVCVLESWRTARPLRREPWFWVGTVLALTPPVADFCRYLIVSSL